MAVAVALSVAGGICELGGLVLVVVAIRRDQKQAERLFVPRPRKEPPTRSYPSRAHPRRHVGFPGSLLGGVSYGGQADQRRIAQALAQSISNIDTAAYNALIDMRKTLDAELDKAADDLWADAAEADNQLREQLRYVLAGSISDRVKGATLLGVGIIFAMAGSVLGTLS